LSTQATVEDVGPCRRKLRITVPSSQISQEVEKSYRELLAQVRLPGFRQGHVPRRVLERRFGDEIWKEVKQSIISTSFHETLQSESLEPIGDPEIDYEGIQIDPAVDLTYEVTIEIKPDVRLDGYKGMNIHRPAVEATAEEVQEALQGLARSRSVLEPHTGPSELSSVLIADLELVQNDEVIETREDVSLQPERGHILGVPSPSLPDALIGLEKGAHVELELDLSQGGKATVVGEEPPPRTVARVKVKDVKTVVTPEIADAWAKELDFEDLADLTDNVRKRLLQKKTRDTELSIEEQLVDRLLEQCPFEMPQKVVEQELERAVGRYRIRLQIEGIQDENELDSHVADYRRRAETEVVKDFQKAFLLDKLASMEKIYVTEDEIDQQISAIAAAHGKGPDEVKEHYESRNMLPDLRAQIREAKARRFLRENAEILEEATDKK